MDFSEGDDNTLSMDRKLTTLAAVALLAIVGFDSGVHAATEKPATQNSEDDSQQLAAWPSSSRTAPKPIRAAKQVSSAERNCLALNIYWESRGQPIPGQAAVAHVTLNRAGSGRFPSSICGVVQQGGTKGSCQFNWYCDSVSDKPTDRDAWALAQKIADRTLAGEPDPTRGALYFHHVGLKPSWARNVTNRMTIGHHVFFSLRR